MNLFDTYDTEGDEEYHSKPYLTRCESCGAHDLHWEDVGDEDGGKLWRLVNSHGELHHCPKRTASAADFEDLSGRG